MLSSINNLLITMSYKVTHVTITDFLQSSDIKKKFHLKFQGSEAKIFEGFYLGMPAILKERFVKNYRHPDLDKVLTNERVKAEVRALSKCYDIEIKCPAVYFVDMATRSIIMEYITNSITVGKLLTKQFEQEGVDCFKRLLPIAKKIGENIAKMHKFDLVHGDLTTSNILIKLSDVEKVIANKEFNLYFIDFGLSKRDVVTEDKAVDLYVLERAISSSHPDSEEFHKCIKDAYFSVAGSDSPVANKLEEVRQRGRKRTMVG